MMSQVQSKKRFSGRCSRAVLMSLLAVGAHDFFAASEAFARGGTHTSVNRSANVNRMRTSITTPM
jgi:hypothetical protein